MTDMLPCITRPDLIWNIKKESMPSTEARLASKNVSILDG
jgi:hypothetical protein